jgi:small subunit ribosomal protein S16
VVAEKTRAVKKKVVEVVGNYQPMNNPKSLEIDTEKVMEWISKGAQPSNTVASLLKKLGMKDMERYMSAPNKKKKKKKETESAA